MENVPVFIRWLFWDTSVGWPLLALLALVTSLGVTKRSPFDVVVGTNLVALMIGVFAAGPVLVLILGLDRLLHFSTWLYSRAGSWDAANNILLFVTLVLVSIPAAVWAIRAEEKPTFRGALRRSVACLFLGALAAAGGFIAGALLYFVLRVLGVTPVGHVSLREFVWGAAILVGTITALALLWRWNELGPSSHSSSPGSYDYARYQRLAAAQSMRVSGQYSEEEVMDAFDRVDNP